MNLEKKLCCFKTIAIRLYDFSKYPIMKNIFFLGYFFRAYFFEVKIFASRFNYRVERTLDTLQQRQLLSVPYIMFDTKMGAQYGTLCTLLNLVLVDSADFTFRKQVD